MEYEYGDISVKGVVIDILTNISNIDILNNFIMY